MTAAALALSALIGLAAPAAYAQTMLQQLQSRDAHVMLGACGPATALYYLEHEALAAAAAIQYQTAANSEADQPTSPPENNKSEEAPAVSAPVDAAPTLREDAELKAGTLINTAPHSFKTTIKGAVKMNAGSAPAVETPRQKISSVAPEIPGADVAKGRQIWDGAPLPAAAEQEVPRPLVACTPDHPCDKKY